jgi:hypothetical protein
VLVGSTLLWLWWVRIGTVVADLRQAAAA